MKTYIKIDPVKELLKAIEIIHGKARADMWWMILLRTGYFKREEEFLDGAKPDPRPEQ